MGCPICKSKRVRLIFKKYPGYFDGTTYSIFECENCDIQYVPRENIDSQVYKKIYSTTHTPGYDRYFRYAKEIKTSKNPLLYLRKQETSYVPIFDFLKGKISLKILEVGCGYGYLTYALRKAGHEAIGIDISENAIKYAKANFGKTFELTDLKDYKPGVKFDLIVATELIEHLGDVNSFISLCGNLLEKNGKLMFTTPNKGIHRKDRIWKTDLPPVHLTWFSKKSFEKISNKYNFDCKFVDLSRNIGQFDNNLIYYLLAYKNTLPLPVLDTSGNLYSKRVIASKSSFRSLIFRILNLKLVRMFSNFLYRLCIGESAILCVIFTKK